MTELTMPVLPRTRTYQVESASRVEAGGRTLEYHEKALVEVALLGYDSALPVFRLRAEPPQATGNSPVFAWANDVNAFLRELVVQVDNTGHIQQVLNHAELLAKWPAHREALRQAYAHQAHAQEVLHWLNEAVQEPGFLKNQITAHGVYDFLFPGLYRAYPASGLLSSKKISNFFGAIDLPLSLQSTVQPATTFGGYTVLSSVGELDAAAVDEDGFRRFLKDATDVYNVKTALTAEFEATYQLDAQQWPVEAELFLHVQAGGSAYRNTLARKFISH